MKSNLFAAILLTAISLTASAQDASIFPKGEKGPNVHHTGNVWLKELVKADSILDCHVSVATFEAGAKLDWHKHPAGQILMIIEGTGYYQEKGQPKKMVNKGDVIICLPNVEHWHSASAEKGVTYLAMNANNEKGKTIWLQKVTDEEYVAGQNTSINSLSAEQEIINLSKKKWLWMSDKNADSLNALFNNKSVFVHMGGSWGKEKEMDIIKSGGIWYKKADIKSVSVNIIGNTAILLNNITLLAVVGGNEVTNPFIVTEVYIKENEKWLLGSLSFTKLLTPEQH